MVSVLYTCHPPLYSWEGLWVTRTSQTSKFESGSWYAENNFFKSVWSFRIEWERKTWFSLFLACLLPVCHPHLNKHENGLAIVRQFSIFQSRNIFHPRFCTPFHHFWLAISLQFPFINFSRFRIVVIARALSPSLFILNSTHCRGKLARIVNKLFPYFWMSSFHSSVSNIHWFSVLCPMF